MVKEHTINNETGVVTFVPVENIHRYNNPSDCIINSNLVKIKMDNLIPLHNDSLISTVTLLQQQLLQNQLASKASQTGTVAFKEGHSFSNQAELSCSS